MSNYFRCPKRKGQPHVTVEVCFLRCKSKTRWKKCKARKEFEKTQKAIEPIAQRRLTNASLN